MRLMLVLLVTVLIDYSNQEESSRSTTVEAVFRTREHRDSAYLAYITFNNGQYCAGTLISHRYVLTAAHCALNSSNSTVFLGNEASGQISIPSKQMETYMEGLFEEHRWGNYHNYDIALIQLSEYVDFTKDIQPAELPTWWDGYWESWIGFPQGKIASLVGWEIDLRWITIEPVVIPSYVTTSNKCLDCKSNNTYDEERTLCTVSEDYLIDCSGISGGPLLIDCKVYGVAMSKTSWERNPNSITRNVTCIGTESTAFTKVTSFLQWIEANTDVNIGYFWNSIYE